MLAFRKIPLDEEIAGLTLPAVGDPLTDEACRRLAYLVAYRGLGHVSPNPLVGAVVVDREQRFLGAGAHLKCGENHAEINAIAGIKPESLPGTTMYVTLEPCTIDGRTPACAPALSRLGLAKIVVGCEDPHPDVQGSGLQVLRQAGITVETPAAWERDCASLAEIFFRNCQANRPFVALKVATGLAGGMAKRGDQRAWITGERARQYGHFLRSYYDAIVVGAETARLDDPTLNARDALTSRRDPLPVILDPGAQLADLDIGLLRRPSQDRVFWLVADDAEVGDAHAEQVEVVRLAASGGKFGVMELLDLLYQRGVKSLLVEGGPTTAGIFAASGTVDKYHVFQAASVLGGPDVLNWANCADSPFSLQMQSPVLTPLGDDWMIEAGRST